MPRGNKKGPMGDGPSTGRGLGYCTGHDEPGCQADGPRMGGAGRGLGRGRGCGAGRGQGGRGRGLRRRVQDLEARLADNKTEDS